MCLGVGVCFCWIFKLGVVMEIVDRMVSGEKYRSDDPYLVNLRAQVRDMLWEYNGCRPSDVGRLGEIIRGLFGSVGEGFEVTPPFRCDYGFNIRVGRNFYSNFNLTVLDEGLVEIGDNVFIGPNVGIYTACHPIEAEERNGCVEWSRGVRIGDNVWIGGGVTICPGVSIGEGSVVGAGSVVVRDVPSWSVVVGNPARVVRRVGGCS